MTHAETPTSKPPAASGEGGDSDPSSAVSPPDVAPGDVAPRETWRRAEARWSGLALMVGGAALFAVMTHHPEPSARDMSTFFEQVRGFAALNRVVHGGALGAVLLLVFGFFGMIRVIDRYSVGLRASQVLFAFGSLAGAAAGLLNGFLGPALAFRYETADLETLEVVRPVASAANEVAQLCAQGSVIGWSGALLLMGGFLVARAREKGPRSRAQLWSGSLAVFCGLPPLVSILAGWLAVDVFGYTLFVASQVVWFVVAGWLLRRGSLVELPSRR